MIVLKCPMCGGNLPEVEGATTVTCKYCGTATMLVSAAGNNSPSAAPPQPDIREFMQEGYAYLAQQEYAKAAGAFNQAVRHQPENPEVHIGLLLSDARRQSLEEINIQPGVAQHNIKADNSHLLDAIRFAKGSQLEALGALRDALRQLEAYEKAGYEYRQLLRFEEEGIEYASSKALDEKFRSVGNTFKRMKDYADAPAKAEKCFEKADELEKLLQEYNGQKALQREAEAQKRRKAILAVAAAASLLLAVWMVFGVFVPASRYSNALRAAEALYQEGQYEQALHAYEALDTKEAQDGAARAFSAWANELLENGQYSQAVGVLTQGAARAPEESLLQRARYGYGLQLIEQENYADAQAQLEGAGGYKESGQLAYYCALANVGSLNVGEIVTLGSFLQDGVQPLTWQVISQGAGGTRLLATDVLVLQGYHMYVDMAPYEETTLHAWLNNDFIETAFSPTEQQLLREDDGSAVSLLTLSEVKALSSTMRASWPTALAMGQGDPVGWWLASEVSEDKTAQYVGLVEPDKWYTESIHTTNEIGVRPAVWLQSGIDIKPIIEQILAGSLPPHTVPEDRAFYAADKTVYFVAPLTISGVRDALVETMQTHDVAYGFASQSISTSNNFYKFKANAVGSRNGELKFESYRDNKTFHFSGYPTKADEKTALLDVMAVCISYVDSATDFDMAREKAAAMLGNYSTLYFGEPLQAGEYTVFLTPFTGSAAYVYFVHQDEFWNKFRGYEEYEALETLPPAVYEDSAYRFTRLYFNGTVTSVVTEPKETYNVQLTIMGDNGKTYNARYIYKYGPFIPAVGERFTFYAVLTNSNMLDLERMDEA